LGLLHRFLDRVRRPHGHSRHYVVAFHVSGRTFDERLARNASRRLRAFGKRIHLGSNHDYRLSRSPFRPDIGRQPGAAELDFEADLLQRLLQVLRAFVLLHSRLGEVVKHVADSRDCLGIAVDRLERDPLGIRGRVGGY